MGALHFGDSRLNFQLGKTHGRHVSDEIEGLIRVYNDGYVERLPVIPNVPCTWGLGPDTACIDVEIDRQTNVWARIYTPRRLRSNFEKLPIVVYFHGGGFCVGSASWSCYHQFLSRLSASAHCVIISVNYRLAPEHRLPIAYNDGLMAMKWLRNQARYRQNHHGSNELNSWINCSNFHRVFLSGDSAGATIAYHVATCVESTDLLFVRGVILIQPFFGGEIRTWSEKNQVESSGSALSLATSDCYWRLALPVGSTRDDKWCNPLGKGSPKLESLSLPPLLVCTCEFDILKDRNIDFCKALKSAGKSVEQVVYGGVGHAFQVLNNYPLSQVRTKELLLDVTNFINGRK
ncbi:hypothetical protein LUZ60_006138 [Juncus effusus]|nr:hypothetical protein LUZ60_006138 [Juncus effusus]